MDKHHTVENVLFQQNQLCLTVDGRHYHYRLDDISTVLAGATGEQREYFEVSPGGYGIHWPLLDEDLSIDGLLRLSRHNEPPHSASQTHSFQK